MDLVTLDHIANGGSGVLETQPGHIEVERYRSATKWATGAHRQYRIGATIGPHRYSDLGAWDANGPRELDAWPAIDLRAHLSARAGVRAAVSRCGYACDWGDDYGLTVRRGGVAVHLVPVALAWVNDRGQTQVIATPTPGRPVVVDDAGLWALDAFGAGIDIGARFWPDMVRAPVIRVNNPAALFVGLNRPTIDPTGLRLAKILNIGYDGGQPDRSMLFRQSRFRRQARAAHLTGRADETRSDPGKVPIKHTRGDALWFGEARAWDDEQGWPLRQDWRRYGDDMTLSLSLAAEDVAAAVGPLCLDTTITEELIPAGEDDAENNLGVAFDAASYFRMTGRPTVAGTTYTTSAWDRFTSIPIPNGASVQSASIKYQAVNFSVSSTTVNLALKLQNEDSAARVTTMSQFEGLSLTSAVAWDNVGTWDANSFPESPSIAALVESVVGRAEWSTNGAIGIVLMDNGSSDGAIRRSYTYEADPGSGVGSRFNATYTAGGTPAGQPFAARIAGIPHMGIRGWRPGRGR